MNTIPAHGLSLVAPKVVPILDPGFRPAVLANRAFRAAASACPVPVRVALERIDGGVSRFDTMVADASLPAAAGNFQYLERLVKFLLWSRGGWKVLKVPCRRWQRRIRNHGVEA